VFGEEEWGKFGKKGMSKSGRNRGKCQERVLGG